MTFPFPNNHSAISSQTFSSKDELQEALKSANVDLKWHESGRSELDRVFGKYDEMERFKSYIVAGCSLLFWEAIQCRREFYFSDVRFHSRFFFSRFGRFKWKKQGLQPVRFGPVRSGSAVRKLEPVPKVGPWSTKIGTAVLFQPIFH